MFNTSSHVVKFYLQIYKDNVVLFQESNTIIEITSINLKYLF